MDHPKVGLDCILSIESLWFRSHLQGGGWLSESFSDPHLFPSIPVKILDSAEKPGILGVCLTRKPRKMRGFSALFGQKHMPSVLKCGKSKKNDKRQGRHAKSPRPTGRFDSTGWPASRPKQAEWPLGTEGNKSKLFLPVGAMASLDFSELLELEPLFIQFFVF